MTDYMAEGEKHLHFPHLIIFFINFLIIILQYIFLCEFHAINIL